MYAHQRNCQTSEDQGKHVKKKPHPISIKLGKTQKPHPSAYTKTKAFQNDSRNIDNGYEDL